MIKIRDEINSELSDNGYDKSDINLIKIRLIDCKEYNGYKYDYIGDNLLEVENFEYDNGYGRQKLYGYIWLKDGSWLERHEYDGSEWWCLYHPNGPDKNVELDNLVI